MRFFSIFIPFALIPELGMNSSGSDVCIKLLAHVQVAVFATEYSRVFFLEEAIYPARHSVCTTLYAADCRRCSLFLFHTLFYLSQNLPELRVEIALIFPLATCYSGSLSYFIQKTKQWRTNFSKFYFAQRTARKIIWREI
jgi:hypothetical protein